MLSDPLSGRDPLKGRLEVTMTQPLVECIPNFSEGRRLDVIEAIVTSIGAVNGVRLLDRHSDADHNRSVVTFAGAPEAVSGAAFAAIRTAAELIDLDQHRGEHPRIGATDVVPFVPLAGTTMDQCVSLARDLGERVGSELGIPVYLYEAAATRPDRVNLENLRRGEYEGLKLAIETDPDRAPDFGPMKLGKAGATVIGARQPLIAFNVYLATDDVNIAKEIARSIRQSSGGLPCVKALGLLVEGRAQVSMNLTDYTQTPLHRVVEKIRQEAARQAVALHHSELVGLIPLASLVDSARWYLQLDDFTPEQVLETRLYASFGQAGQAGPTFLEQLAQGTPAPGGGSAAAYAGAMAAALVAMVARLTSGKKKYAQVEQRMGEIAVEADRLRAAQEAAVDLDSGAFTSVMAAMKLPRETEAEQTTRAAALEAGAKRAGEVPLQVSRDAVATLELAAEVVDTGNVNAVSDAGSGASLAQAALSAAGLNVRVNAASLTDRRTGEEWLAELHKLEARAEAAVSRVRRALMDRAGLEV